MKRAQRNMLLIKLFALALVAGVGGFLWWHELAIGQPRARCLQTAGAEWNEQARSCHIPASFTCEKNGGWWEPISKTCAKVIYIPDITRRK